MNAVNDCPACGSAICTPATCPAPPLDSDLSDSQRRVLKAMLAAGATGEIVGRSPSGDTERNQTQVRAMVEAGLLPSSHVGRTLRSLEDRGLVAGRTTLLNQDWGNWCQWWLTPEGCRAAHDQKEQQP